MSNTSQTGGYIQPLSTRGLPGGLTLTQFIQTLLVGLTEIPGQLVRPDWQPEEPKQPSGDTNWMAFGLFQGTPDYSAATQVVPGDAPETTKTVLRRNYSLEIRCQFYGPNAFENYCLFADGFQITQNTDALTLASMGYTDLTQALRVPDNVGGKWIDRWVSTLTLKWERQRVYPIVTLVSANGVVHTALGNEEYLIDWNTNPEET